MHAKVLVTLRPGVLDPAGQAIADGLRQLGFAEVRGVRVGKILEIDIEESSLEKARSRVADMSARLLANPVVEHYEVELHADSAGSGSSDPSAPSGGS